MFDPPPHVFESVFASAGVALCLLDPQGRIVVANAEWLAVAMLEGRDVTGRDMWELFPEASPETRRRYDDVRRDGKVIAIPAQAQRRNGEERWLEGKLTPVPFDTGVGVLITAMDVTARVRAERELGARETQMKEALDALRRSERTLRDAQRLAAIGSWDISFTTGERRWSEEVYRIFGRDPDLGPAAPAELRLCCASEDWLRVAAAVEAVREQPGPVEVNVCITRPDGAVRFVVARGEAVRDDAGATTGLRGTVQDVTERRSAEEALRAVRDQLSAVVHACPVPIVTLDLEGKVVLWSAAAERVFGWTQAEVAGRPLPIVPQDKVDEHGTIQRATQESRPSTNLVTHRMTRDGRRIPVSLSTAPLRGPKGEPEGNVAVVVDLSEQAALYGALAEAEDRFGTAFEASPMAKLVVRESDHRVFEANREYLRLSGLAREQVVGHDADGLLWQSPADRSHFWARLADERHLTDFAFAYRTRAGRDGDGVISAQRILLSGESYALVVVQDVTERRHAERALMESEARFRQLAEAIQEVFWLTDPAKGQLIYISPAYEQIWGRTCESVRANPRDWLEAVHPDDRERVLHAALTKQSAGLYDEEYRIVRPDGCVRWIRDRAFPVRDAAGNVVRIAGTAEDITSRRELEEQLRQTQKMESIGLLAGGVAHDFNNLLTVITGNAHTLRETAPLHGESAELLGEVLSAGERASALTRQLLSFSRREVVQPRVVDLAVVVMDAEKMLRRILGEDVVMTTSIGREPARAKVDPSSWVQVLMNLAVNARDAMPRGGKLAIELRHCVLRENPSPTRPRLPAGDYVLLTVSDTGTGMTPDVQARIFEPFFTTKRPGSGTGLGLSVVHGIVEQSGGHVEVSSAPGVGTTFRIYIPVADEGPRAASTVASASNLVGTETILVVEDEDAIRRVAIRVLAKVGYRVLQAAEGVGALAVAESAGQIDLLFTDVVMPRMGGWELVQALRARRPNLRVLYTSGHTDDAVLRHGIQHAEVAFLPKPYDPTALRGKVREVLDTNPGA